MTEQQSWFLDTGKVSNTVAEAKDEDLWRVTESMAKASQMRAQIKQMQQQDAIDAALLMLLFKHISDAWLLQELFTMIVKQSIPVRSLFPLFLPMLYQVVTQEAIKVLYTREFEQLAIISGDLVSYVWYIKPLRTYYPALQKIDFLSYIAYITKILQSYDLIDMETMDESKKQEFLGVLEKELS